MTLSMNVSVTTPMNQTQTTSPTDGGVDRGSRPPASRHILRALSAVKVSEGNRHVSSLRVILGRVAVSVAVLVVVGLVGFPALAQEVTVDTETCWLGTQLGADRPTVNCSTNMSPKFPVDVVDTVCKPAMDQVLLEQFPELEPKPSLNNPYGADYGEIPTTGVSGYFCTVQVAPKPLATECSDESIDWTTAATEEGWSCTVDGTAYEYLDFHVIKKMAASKGKTCESFTGDMNGIKACASTVDGNDAYFIVLGTWSNNKNTSFEWVDGFTQFGRNFKTGKREQIDDNYRAFYKMGGDGGPAMGGLDTSNITEADAWFWEAESFNRDISGWDTSNMTKMRDMFNNARAFRGRNLSRWDVGQVTDMSRMFTSAWVFNQNLSAWNVSKVTTMAFMFQNAEAFNQDLSGWNVSKSTVHLKFDDEATAWCGLGFENRGRPGGWDPSDDGDRCLNLEIQAPDTALAGTEVQFVLQYSNATDAEFTGTMTFTVPAGMTVTASSGTLEGRTVTWSDLSVRGVVAEAAGHGQDR